MIVKNYRKASIKQIIELELNSNKYLIREKYLNMQGLSFVCC